MRLSRRTMIAAGSAALATVASAVVAVTFNNAATASAALDEMPSAVEDFSYPGAAQILAEKNVRLVSGDGRIVLADCATPPAGDLGLIEVYTTDLDTNGDGTVCFRVLGRTGLLNMEVPAVFEIRGDGQRAGTGHDITAVIQPEGAQPTTVEVDPDGSTQVGIGTDPPGAPTTLLQLKVTG